MRLFTRWYRERGRAHRGICESGADRQGGNQMAELEPKGICDFRFGRLCPQRFDLSIYFAPPTLRVLLWISLISTRFQNLELVTVLFRIHVTEAYYSPDSVLASIGATAAVPRHWWSVTASFDRQVAPMLRPLLVSAPKQHRSGSRQKPSLRCARL